MHGLLTLATLASATQIGMHAGCNACRDACRMHGLLVSATLAGATQIGMQEGCMVFLPRLPWPVQHK
jgi:hypothetical protein